VYKNISRFRNESKLSTWIASIAWNTCADYLKKHRRDRLELLESIPAKAEMTMTDEATWRVIHEADMKVVVRKGIEQLPLPYQTVLTLYHLEEFSYSEIEEITGMPEGTVKSYLNRARKQLRKILEHALPGEAGVFHRMEP
jgi:RNA polymerase sigma-70 factor (ECF subfamily)